MRMPAYSSSSMSALACIMLSNVSGASSPMADMLLRPAVDADVRPLG
eukprot:CAMPEP_0115865672 /NCGR_PEP_ID=MMETSP0287-20121206/19844_1 /TAXON_ID=412157 /ORGANISM="Chrysochromulina rotalis, Strain UIO044" /LENGTH=46 /DNA_ID= /DNA_START= /DNA_END= /DNA_ORIENTATION=